MKGRTVLVPGAGGTAPYVFTAGLMSESGADPAGTQFVRDLSSDMLTELFLGGLGDAIICDLLGANWLAYRGVGSQAQTLAGIGGPMPNSVYYVRRDRLAELRGRLVRFMAAIGRSMTILERGHGKRRGGGVVGALARRSRSGGGRRSGTAHRERDMVGYRGRPSRE